MFQDLVASWDLRKRQAAATYKSEKTNVSSKSNHAYDFQTTIFSFADSTSGGPECCCLTND